MPYEIWSPSATNRPLVIATRALVSEEAARAKEELIVLTCPHGERLPLTDIVLLFSPSKDKTGCSGVVPVWV